MAENINWTLYFPSNERCIAEFEILNTKLQVQLKADLSKVYSESLYSDLELVFDSGSVHTHSSLLQTRAPQFFSQICSSPCSLVVLSQVDRYAVESFIREVYSQNKLQEKELAVVEYLSKVKKHQEEVLTPESDTYATPELTPTDVKHTFGPTRCVSDSGLSSLIESKALHSTNTLYYSLVTVDEVYSSDSAADILEKELAEQDQLLKSFKSIISKDSKSTKGEVKSFYLTPKNRSSSFQYTPKHNNSKKKKGLELKLPLKLSFKDKYSLTQFDNNINGNVPKKAPFNLEQFSNYKELNPVEEAANVYYLWNSGSAKKFSFTERQCEPNMMSKVKPGREESMDGESVGVSSGYLTGSSPKEHTVSELANTEDIPHDNDRSARSSSVSSDAGTWEPPVVDRTVVLSDHDSSVNININNGENLNVDAFTISYPANSTNHKNNSRRNTLDSSSRKEFPASNYDFSQIGSSESGNGSQTHSSPSTNEETPLDNKLCNGKSNFFIDAASLLDESEISSMPPNSLSYNGHEFGEYNSLQLWSDSTLSDKPLQMTNKLDQVAKHENKLKQNDISPEGDNNDLEMRRSSLIRRNTFELEPDDERLAVLRNEYEKHKQRVNNQRQNCFNSSSKEGFDNEIVSLNRVQPDENNLPNSLPVALTKPQAMPKVDEDMHSPDSLNNDNPLENPFETHLRDDNPNYSLPYDVNTDCKDRKQSLYDCPNQNNESPQSINVLNQCHSSENIYKGFERQASVNKLESAPILSGGVFFKDISSPEKSFSSPLMNRRKTELTPIVSGGAVMEPQVEPEPKPRTASSLSSSWVVDMSDTMKSPQESRKNRKRDPLSSVNSSESPKSEELTKPAKTNNSSLGFFVPLDDLFDEKSPADSGYKSSNFHSIKDCDSEKSFSRVETSSNSKNISNSGSSCGFYVDFNDTKPSCESVIDKESALPDKKLFSMFIDISESGDSGTKSKTSSPLAFKKRTHSRNLSGVFSQKSEDKSKQFSSQVSSESSLEITESPDVSLGQKKESGPPMHLRQIFGPQNSGNMNNKNKKQGFYMFVDADPSPTAQRRTFPSNSQSSSHRHSWNSDCDSPQILPAVVNTESGRKKVHRRSHSVSVNKSLEVMFNVEKQEQSNSTAFKGSTSNSIGYESGPSSMDDTASRHHNSMMASWHGSVKPSLELQKVLETVEKKENQETKTHSRSLIKSRSESKSEHLSEMSRSGDKSEMTYSISREDNLCDLSNESSSGINNSTFVVSDVSNVANATSNEMELTTPTCDLASQLSKDDSDKTETDFDENAGPKSADIPRTPDHSISQVDVPMVEHKFSFVKLSDMDKEPKKKMGEGRSVMNRMSRSIPETSWIESKMMTRSATSRSLSRLFPHLRNKTPDSADHDTDYSEMSSMQSSMDPSALEGSTEDTDVSSCGGPVSRLGEDLLRMFLDEISPDVTVEVGGRRIKAHKCILSSRCQYFAAILSGGWVESAGNVISLQGFSYSAVHFALCHIYSGASNVPDSINIVELATLADMLCLEGLKEVIMYTLKVKYCHFFHKPCPMCTVGVLECLPLAAAYGLDEIYRKSLRWITKYFVRVWPTKGFATLPRELLDKCYKQHIVHMTVDNVLETVLCCSKLQGLIPNVRWAEPVFSLANKLHDAAVKFIALHFSDILSSDMFMSLGKEQMWSMSQLEETLLSAAEKLPPDQACKCHSHLYKLTVAIQAPSPSLPLPLSINDGFVEFLRLLSSTVEGCLLKQAARASRTPAWTLMEPHLRHKIQDTACLVIVPGDDRRRARHLLKRGEGSAPSKRSLDSTASKPSVSETMATKKTTPARSSLPPATVKPKTPQPINKAENSGPRPKTWPYKISEVKSRYLEPKQTPKQSPALTAAKQDKPTLTPTTRRSMNKQIISSSDSSRTSSPAMRRSVPVRPASAGKREDLTMSTDSLADPPLKKKPDTAPKIDFVERNMRAISIKTSTIKFLSTEATTQRKASSITRIEGDKPRYSPMSKRSSSQSSPAAAAVKSTVNSTPSPSNRHNTMSPQEKSHVAAETKSSMLKRTSTYRVQPKSASPNKLSATRTKEPAAASPNIKGNINKIQSKVNGSKKSANNNNLSNYNKTEQRAQPMVGSRSGTFLKDEPTVLKKPQVVNVSE